MDEVGEEDCLEPAPVLKVKQLNKAKIRSPLAVLAVCICVCAHQHGTLCHCDGSRPEQWREAGGGGKQEAMNITRKKKSETKGFIAGELELLISV